VWIFRSSSALHAGRWWVDDRSWYLHCCTLGSRCGPYGPEYFSIPHHDSISEVVVATVFLSASGGNAKCLAGILHDWRSQVSPTLQPWRRRNINVSNLQIKERAYITLVCPILEYSSTVWIHTLQLQQRKSNLSNVELLAQHWIVTEEHLVSEQCLLN